MTYEHDASFQEEVIDRLARIEVNTAAAADRLNDHETRLRTTEHRQGLLAGAVGLFAPVLAWLGYHISLH